MRNIRPFLLAFGIILLCVPVFPVQAQAGIRLLRDRATLQFPESITFSAEVQSDASITSVVLEYGVDRLTCGTVVAKSFPQFTPAKDVTVTWTWDMRQSGSLPPGGKLWWHWQVDDTAGASYTSPQQTVTWLDSQHPWQTLSGGNVNLHWYRGGASFGRELHDFAAQALTRLTAEVGLSAERPIDLYIYADTDDLKAAVLYEPAWIGGQAYPADNIVIIGITPADLEWGKRTEAHEMTHVLVGQLTFSCLGFVPAWLNEGLAMVGEGGLDDYNQTRFQQAVDSNTLLALRSLGGGFSEESDRANLSYVESYSVVNFLIQQYGRSKMAALLLALRDGATTDQALQTVYGFDLDGLEDAWRASIGAAPRAGTSEPTPVPTPTIVPTIVPVLGVPLSSSTPAPLSTGVPGTVTPAPGPAATSPALEEGLSLPGSPLALIGIGLASLILAAGFAVLIILLVRRRARRQK